MSDYQVIYTSKGEEILVDTTDYEWLNQWTWYIHKGYVVRSGLSTEGDRHRKMIFMHKEIVALNSGVVDHINGVKTDNRRSNLRGCTQAENNRNSSSRVGSTSQYKGVQAADNGRWEATIQLDKKLRFLGYYTDEKVAASVYNYYAKELHGEFARLNDVPYIPPEEWDSYRAILVKKTSRFKGVSFHKATNKWMARVRIDRKDKYLGVFDKEEEAADIVRKHTEEGVLA